MDQKIKVGQLHDVAVHEIGHAFIGAAVGVTMKKIHIWRSWFSAFAGENLLDLTKHSGILEEDLDSFALVYLGGQEAQSLWLHRQYDISLQEARSLTNYGARKDLHGFRCVSACLGGLSKSSCQNKVDTILDRNWLKIVTLSDRLAERRSLSPGSVSSAASTAQNLSGVRQVESITPQMAAESVPA